MPERVGSACSRPSGRRRSSCMAQRSFRTPRRRCWRCLRCGCWSGRIPHVQDVRGLDVTPQDEASLPAWRRWRWGRCRGCTRGTRFSRSGWARRSCFSHGPLRRTARRALPSLACARGVRRTSGRPGRGVVRVLLRHLRHAESVGAVRGLHPDGAGAPATGSAGTPVRSAVRPARDGAGARTRAGVAAADDSADVAACLAHRAAGDRAVGGLHVRRGRVSHVVGRVVRPGPLPRADRAAARAVHRTGVAVIANPSVPSPRRGAPGRVPGVHRDARGRGPRETGLQRA